MQRESCFILLCWGTILLLAAPSCARDLPENFNLEEAVRKTKELQQRNREKKRIREAHQEYRQQRGLPEEDEDDIWSSLYEEQTTGGEHRFNREVELDEVIVTGTSPVVDKPEEEPKRGSLLASKQAPYVHWVCYRGERSAEKLGCCQEIFRAMQQDPSSLCWQTDLKACGHNPNQIDQMNMRLEIFPEDEKKTEKEIAAQSRNSFVQHCTHQLVQFPQELESIPSYPVDGLLPIPPRWSLMQAPTVLKYKPMNMWRQFVLDKKAGIFIKQSDQSPVRITRPIHLKATEVESAKSSAVQGEFSIHFSTKLGLSDEDDEWRLLHHTMKLSSVTPASDESCSAHVTILLFLPDEIRLKSLSKCKPDCQVTVLANTWSKEKASAWGQPSIVALQVDLAEFPTQQLSWTTNIYVEDEEQLVFPSPVVYSAVVKSTVSNAVWQWDGRVKPVLSLLLTDVEEKERLQDMWKMEL